MDDSPPKWLADALATPAEEDMIEVRGCSIHRMAWGRRGRPGLVLVHGGAGHAHWWSFIAPLFPQYRVVALDPATGAQIWRYDPYAAGLRDEPGGRASRGVAYWSDGAEERILLASGEYLVAL